jgi:aldo/keto reductase family protein
MGQFGQPIDFALKNDKEALFMWCANRCAQAFNVIYEYERTKFGSIWSSDDRFYEHGIEILYERLCYAMAIIVDRFGIEWNALRDANDPRFKNPNDTNDKALTFGIFLSRAITRCGIAKGLVLISQVIAGQRDRVLLVSKVEANEVAGDGMARACEASLRRLGTDYLDLYLLHWPVPNSQFSDVVAGFEKLRGGENPSVGRIQLQHQPDGSSLPCPRR